MTATPTDLHDELRRVARGLLARSGRGVGGGTSPVPVDWELLASSGWLGLEVPEGLEGAGATFEEVAVVLHELGRVAASSGYLGSAVLGVGALNLLDASAARDELLAGVAAGSARVAVVVPTGDGDGAQEPSFRLEGAAGARRLSGEAAFVPDAPQADHLLVPAGDPASTPVLVLVSPADRGLTVTDQPVLDATRRFGRVAADRVDVPEAAILRFGTEPGTAVQRLIDRGALAVACDSLGVAEAMLEATVAYAKVRRQFDRPIGSFQAVKHACADMLVALTIGRELIVAAVRSLARDDADAPVAVSMAKAYVGAAAVDVVGKAMQLHGGIGYTWERGVHAYLKRAVLNRSLFGSPRSHRRRLADRYVATAAAAGE